MMVRALGAELWKLKRSRMPLWTALVVLVASGLGLAVIPVLSDPKTQEKLVQGGGMFAKAVEMGVYDPTWANYLRIGTQGMSGSWGIMTFGLVAAYLFGREFTDGTAKTMLTLPMRREYVVAAKLVVLALWVFALGMLSVLLMTGVTVLLGAEGFAWTHVFRNVVDTLGVCALLYVTLPFVAWFAMLGKGYLRPMLYSVAMAMLQSSVMQTSLSRWLPWSMPVHLIGASWSPVPPSSLVPGSWLVAVLVGVVGVATLMWRIDTADVAR